MLLSIETIAGDLGVTRQTVSKFIHSGELKAFRIGKSYRVQQEDLQRFLEANSNFREDETLSLRNARNCVLDYPDKTPLPKIREIQEDGRIRPLLKQHKQQWNSFISGDNLLVLKKYREQLAGKIDLIYIDPPFGTGQNFSDIDNDLAYTDKLMNSKFLEFLRVRLVLLRECLSEQGSIYLHIDKKVGHYVKIVMDEVFGYENFVNDITRIKCNPKNFARNAYGNYSDMILFYAKQRDKNIFNEIKNKLTPKEEESLFPKKDKAGRRYTTNPLHAPGETKDGDTGKAWMGLMPPKGRHWRYSREELTRLNEAGLIEWSDKGNPRKIVYADAHKGKKTQDVWKYKDKGLSYVDYPTQKNHDLLKRIILNSSNPGSVVLDAFAGSGGTLYVARKLGRHFIGIDSSPKSLATVKRLFQADKIKCNYFKWEPAP